MLNNSQKGRQWKVSAEVFGMQEKVVVITRLTQMKIISVL
ncbi:MAG: hypothetical protein ACI9U0_001064 [Flavobacteriales bacterium]|jgi:hypothetical protein|tara:strand:- start:2267 stop:2386 length:120 start_codon:yes stop_codon:yes gene_type:complete